MTPFKHPWCDDVLKAPEGDADCEDLHIARIDNAVMSFWKPSAEELANLVVGGSVGLLVEGNTHPPLSVNVMTPEGERRKCQTADEIKAVYEANRARCDALLRITKRVIAELVKATGDKHEAIVSEFLDLMAFNVGESVAVRNLEETEPTKG